MNQEEYMQSMQMDDDNTPASQLINDYENGIHELNAAVERMTPEQIRARPIAGKWSTQEVVSHVADTEIFMADRIERTIVLDKPLLLAVDERPYIAGLCYQNFDLKEQLDLVSALRRHVARILKMQPPTVWQRTAVHTETGIVNLRQLVLQPTRHLRHHVKFILEKRNALGC